MLDTIPAEPTAGLVVVALAVAIAAVRLLRRHALALAAIAGAVGAAHLLGLRGVDAVVDALAVGLSVSIEALLLLARLVDFVLVAAFDALVGGVERLPWEVPSPAVGLPEVVLPPIGFLGFVASVLVLSLLAGLVLVWFSYETASSPVGAWTGAVGVVLGLAGALWTLLRSNPFDVTTLQLLVAVVAAPVGLALGVLATLVLLKPNYRSLAEHAEELERRFTVEETDEDGGVTESADDAP